MKKLLLSLSGLILALNAFTQTVTIPTGNPATTGAPTTTVLRKPLGSFYGFERSAMIYTAAEIGTSGTINAISFYLDATTSPGAVPTKVYLKETSSTNFAASSTVADEEAGATLVFNQTISTFTAGSFISITLSTPFVYNNTQSLEVIVETDEGGSGNENSTSKTFRYNATSDNKFQYWQADNSAPSSTGTIGTFRPNIQLDIIPGAPCTEPPYVGNVNVNDTTLCVGESVLFSIDSLSYGSGQTNQWQSSNDNSNWTNINGATASSYQHNFTSSVYIRFSTTCGASTVFSNSVHLNTNAASDCYCNTSTATSTADDDIGNVVFGSINNGIATPQTNNTSSVNTYSDFTGISTNVMKGVSYPLTVSQINSGSFYDCEITAFIDFNRDGNFDVQSEKFLVGNTTTGNMLVSTNILIPVNANPGAARMRIVLSETTGLGPCDSYTWGETEDYTLIIEEPSPCTEPPTAGTVIVSDTLVCPTTPVTFTLSGSIYGTGLSYQWQSSVDGSNWTAINGATNTLYNGSFNNNVYIKCESTCGTTTVSTPPVRLNVKPFNQCYCVATHAGCNAEITNVSILGTTLNNDSTCSTTGADAISFPPTGYTTATLVKGLSYDFSITTTADHVISVWIDYNQNGDFETTEWFQVATSTIADTASIKSFTPPISAMSGNTGMRVRTRLTGNENDSTSACLGMGSGETHDYIITLVDPGPCTDPPVAGNTQANNTQICAGNNVYLSLNGITYGTGQTYTWQSSADSSQWNDINGAYQPTYSTNSINVTTYFRCKLTCGTGTSFSVPVKIFVKPFNLCYCNTNLQTNLCDNNTGILGVEIVWENFINYNQCTNGGAAYTSFPSLAVTDNFGLGQIYNVRVLVNSNAYIGMWIDYNQNGIYEATEYTLVANNQTAGTPADAFFTIPQTAVLGETGMRIRARDISFSSTDACTIFSSGETQDYVITIDNSVGLKGKAAKASLYIAPNPANQNITISGRGLDGNQAEITIYSINGAIVKSEMLNVTAGTISGNIDVNNLSQGVYQISIKGNNSILNQKLIIQR